MEGQQPPQEYDDTEKKYQKYLNNRGHINTYLKKRYATDDSFREKRKSDNLVRNKQRYFEDPQFRERIKQNVKSYRERQKAKKLTLTVPIVNI